VTGVTGSGPFQVDHITLHTAAKDVRNIRTEVDGELAKLGNTVDELASAWQGGASRGFQQVMDRWNTDVKKLLQAMDEIANLLDKSADTHQANDDAQQQMLNKFHSALNQ
jgi:WXG100 family type VII secretion target